MNNNAKIKRLKYACYTTNLSMSVVGNLSPILFLTFHGLYGVSYSLLGLLVLVNYVTQLSIDLIFSFFSHGFNIPRTVKLTPVLTLAGLLTYAAWPLVFPGHVYLGLAVGTVIFSASAGFNEVLISPVIAALPAKDPDREMSKLHSVYAWGTVFVVIFSTLFLFFMGGRCWQWLALIFTAIPLASACLYVGTDIPKMDTPKKTSSALRQLKDLNIWLCVISIFLGGAAECTMTQWSSGYIEKALGIPKVQGDIFGVAMFAAMLGMGRTLYSKIGKNVRPVLFFGALCAAGCYLTAALVDVPFVGLAACAFTGFCTSMLWPGNLIVASETFPAGGVFIYALMAAGGDLGASVAPQLLGIVTDAAAANPSVISFAASMGLSPEQAGMKLGMLTGMLFPLAAAPLYLYRWRKSSRPSKNTSDR